MRVVEKIVRGTPYMGEEMSWSDTGIEIVRCRDCNFAFEFEFDEDWEGWRGMLDCSHFREWDYYDDAPGHWPVEPDGFCSWGERRGDGDQDHRH